MHPVLFHLGSFPIGTYGLLLAIAFLAGSALARRQAKLDGLAPASITDLAVAMLIAAILGSKLLLILVDLMKGQPIQDVFSLSTLRAGGAVHGGIIAATATFFWKLRKGRGLPLRTTGDALVPGVALGQAIGRLGCLAAGCCYGTECHLPWAITFTDPLAYVFMNVPMGVPLHPVQLYNTIANLAVLGILLLARSKRSFQGQIFALYFLVEGEAGEKTEGEGQERGAGLRRTHPAPGGLEHGNHGARICHSMGRVRLSLPNHPIPSSRGHAADAPA